MTKTNTPATTAERFLVSINLGSMEVWTDDGEDAQLRALSLCDFPSVNTLYVNGVLCSIGKWELYGELLSFFATPVSEGSQRG